MSVTIEKTVLQVSFPKEKLEALKFYMDEKDTTVEKELQGHVKSIYEKYVPAATRRYLDRNNSAEEVQSEVRMETGEQIQETVNVTPTTRGRRRNAREQDEGTNEAVQAEETLLAEDNSEQTEEVSQGMNMSM